MSLIYGLRSRIAALVNLPLRYPLPPGGAKKSGKDKGPKRVGQLSPTHATGCALLKGEQDPVIKPDNEYPEWLFKLLEPRASSKELQSRYEGMGLTVEQLKRLWRLKNKERIKESNFLKAKQ